MIEFYLNLKKINVQSILITFFSLFHRFKLVYDRMVNNKKRKGNKPTGELRGLEVGQEIIGCLQYNYLIMLIVELGLSMMYVFPLVSYVHASGSTLTGNQGFSLLSFLQRGHTISSS